MAHWYADRFPCTSSKHSANARVKVDVAETSFFEGREFRTFKEFSLANIADSVILKFTCAKEFILHGQHFEVDAGGIRFEAIAAGTDGRYCFRYG